MLITALLTIAPLSHAVAQPAIDAGPLHVELRVQGLTDRRDSTINLESSSTDRFDTARRRIGVKGSIGSTEFQIERELSGGGWKDLYANQRISARLQVQGGQFKVPFGLDENTSSSRLDFVYRSRAATELAPGRAVGVMAHGRIGFVRYEGGFFDQHLTAGRVVVQPLRKRRSVFEDLQAGIAWTASPLQEGVSNLRGDTALGQRFFEPVYLVRGHRQRIGAEVRWRPGPFSVQSEITRVSDGRAQQATDNTDLPSLSSTAWYLQGSWILTGERKTKGADDPKRPLFAGGFGSVEIAGRVESLSFGTRGVEPVIAPRSPDIPYHADRVLTAGINWSPNRWVRIQANVIRERVIDEAGATWGGPPVVWSRLVRVRFAL